MILVFVMTDGVLFSFFVRPVIANAYIMHLIALVYFPVQWNKEHYTQ